MFAPLKRGYVTQGHHLGKAIDIGWVSLNLVNPPILSFDDGIVADVWFERNAGGNCVTIIHPHSETEEIMTLYAHLHSVSVKPGESVFGGQEIGLGGRTGVVTGAHLHYEVWLVPKGYKFNRSNYFRGDRAKYSVDPFPLIIGDGIDARGKGVFMSYKVDDYFQGKAKTTSKVLRMRTQPSLSALSVGHMPSELPVVGRVLGKIDGYTWIQVKFQGRILFVASEFVTIESNDKTVEVTKIVEVEKPININTVVDGIEISIKKPSK